MINQKEQLFFEKLGNIFVGEEIEADSGFANLMKIKNSYFNEIFQNLKEDIIDKTDEFPDFREELYNKLYTFLKKYFPRSGSILFVRTNPNYKIYERVYDNNKDVSLFWKTRMLYYVKTDIIWNNLNIKDYEKNGNKYNIHFDVTKMEGKTASQKKNIIFELGNVDSTDVTFYVLFSRYGSKTKMTNLRRELNKKDIPLSEEDLNQIFTIFKKQNEVDFFINKDAEKVLERTI